MAIRTYEPEDLDALVAMYLQGNCEFAFPDLEHPKFVSKLVLEDEGKARIAILARRTTEIFLFLDHRYGRPKDRWQNFQRLHRASESELLEKGFTDAHAWLPPELAARFGRRLESLGWVKDNHFTPYCKYLVPDREPQVAEEAHGTGQQ